MDTTKYGSKYDAHLSTPQIASLVRNEIKAAVKSKALPALAATVRSRTGTQHASIEVTITEAPFWVFEDDYLRAIISDPMRRRSAYAFTAEARDVMERITEIANAYNFDGSDPQADYYHKNFYFNVKFDQSLTDIERTLIATEMEQEFAA